MRRGLWQIVAGLVLGLAAAIPVAHLMASLPISVSPSDLSLIHIYKVLKASSVQGDIGDKLPVDYGTDRCIGGVEREAAGIDDDGFGDRTNLQADEQSPGIADVQKQAGELRRCV